MASSQVQVAAAAASSTFGCVLRDRNHRDRGFQKNLKHLLVHSCGISRQQRNFGSDSDENENENGVDFTDLWVHKPEYLGNRNSENNQWNSNRASENWGKVKDIVLPAEKKSVDSEISEYPHLGGGVSSLVRKWSDIESEAKTSNSISRSNSASPRISDACEEYSVDGRMNDDSSSLGGWESGPPSVRGTEIDATESERIRVADIIRKLSSSTADENHDRETTINGGNEAALLPRIRTSVDHHHQPEQLRCFFSPVLNSPRIIRGRQAFNCFLMQIERDRARELEGLAERNAVSRFQQRCRIQAVLRLKLLRHGAESRYDRPLRCTSSESNRKPKSSILHLREIFNAGVQHSQAESKAMPWKVPDNDAKSGKVSASNQSREENHHIEVVDSTSTNGNVSTSLGLKEENHPQVEQITSGPQRELAKIMLEKDLKIHHREVVDNTSTIGDFSTSYQLQEDDRSDDLVEQISSNIVVAATDPMSSQKEVALITQHSVGYSFTSNQLEINHNCQQANSAVQHSVPQQKFENFHDEARWKKLSSEVGCSNKSTETAETACPISNSEVIWEVEQRASDEFSLDWEEEIASQQPVESDCGWVSRYSHTQSEWDDQESGFPQQPEVGQDWVTDVSRPRSEWEDLRQERYKEMLDPFLDNNDVRELLQRRSVSNFLSGSMREKIDQMILSRSQRQSVPANSNMHEEVREIVPTQDEGVKVAELVHGGGEEYKEVDKYYGSGDEYEDDSQIQEQPDDIAAQVVHQTWLGHNQDRNISIASDQIASTSLPQSQSADFYTLRPYASSTHHPSIEIELIYGLRGHIEQLRQEMSEIRSSVKSCLNMQVKLQHSIKHEVVAALSQSGLESSSKHPSSGKCCICCEMKIDCLLYRCGHMCTCFKCAHELVWGSGKCPICEAPILDVVRAVYAHS